LGAGRSRPQSPGRKARTGSRSFDRKFGADFVRELPAGPAVYLFKDGAGRVLYAGKAKDVRRRLAGYRNAGRRKAHRKMRKLVREAASIEVRPQPTERAALELENELIRTLRPRYNVDGAYSFLYPAVGLGRGEAGTLLAFTTRPEAWEPLGLAWYGCFRSRLRAREAFDAWTALLSELGHPEPPARLPRVPRFRGSRLLALRQLPRELVEASGAYWAGASRRLLPTLAMQLLEKPAARAHAADVQDHLHTLDAFYASDTGRLREAQLAAGRPPGFVPREERDLLFIAARAAGDDPRTPAEPGR